jgi:hypothetical protein
VTAKSRQDNSGSNIIDAILTIAVLAIGFFLAATSLNLPFIVQVSVFIVGILALWLCFKIIRSMLFYKLLTKEYYRLFFLILLFLSIAFVLSISPSINQLISEILAKALKFK